MVTTMTPKAWWWLVALGLPLFTVVMLLVFGILQVDRVSYVRSRCSSCGMAQAMLFYRISIRSVAVELPYGMDIYNGNSNCPHTLVYE